MRARYLYTTPAGQPPRKKRPLLKIDYAIGFSIESSNGNDYYAGDGENYDGDRGGRDHEVTYKSEYEDDDLDWKMMMAIIVMNMMATMAMMIMVAMMMNMVIITKEMMLIVSERQHNNKLCC